MNLLDMFLHQLLISRLKLANFAHDSRAVMSLDVTAQTKIRAQSSRAIFACETLRRLLTMKSLVMLERRLIDETFGTFITFISSSCLVLLQVNLEASFVVKLLPTNLTAVNVLRVRLHVMIETILRHIFPANSANFRDSIDLKVALVSFLLHRRRKSIVAVTAVKRVDRLNVGMINFTEAGMFLPSRWTKALSAADRADGVRNFKVHVHVIFEIFIFCDFIAAQIALEGNFYGFISVLLAHVIAESFSTSCRATKSTNEFS